MKFAIFTLLVVSVLSTVTTTVVAAFDVDDEVLSSINHYARKGKQLRRRDDQEEDVSNRTLKKRKKNKEDKKPGKCKKPEDDIKLIDYKQWQDETGYWIGDLDFYDSNGDENISSNWNYRYRSYRGFITGNVVDNKYRQRNVFVYPPQTPERCASNPSVVGEGVCGDNGNTKVFEADQSALVCPETLGEAGDIEGDFGDFFYTTTELVGKRTDNAVLYQVWLKPGIVGNAEERLQQSQLTTLTRNLDGTQVYRTRTAQGIEAFNPTKIGTQRNVSFYRERRVSKEEFYTALEQSFEDFNILESDQCAWITGPTGGAASSGYTPGIDACRAHLEQSFELF